MEINIIIDKNMKKIVLFILLAVFVTGCINSSSPSENKSQKNEDFIIFDEPGDVVETKSFKVFQVLEKGFALAHGLSDAKYEWYHGPTYLLKDDNHYFTDEEIFKASKGKIFRQVGVYTYSTRGGQLFGTEIPSEKKTVAVIEMFSK